MYAPIEFFEYVNSLTQSVWKVMKPRKMNGRGMQHAWERKIHVKFYLYHMKGANHLTDTGFGVRTILKLTVVRILKILC